MSQNCVQSFPTGSAPMFQGLNPNNNNANQFKPATLSIPGQFVIIESNQLFVNVTRIRGWSEEVQGLGTLIKEFSWSVDKSSWSYWTLLTQENLEALSNRNILPKSGFYFRFRYTLSSIGNIVISGVKLNVEQSATDTNLGYVPPGFFCAEFGSMQGSILTTCGGSFNPYLINPCNDILQQLAYGIQNMFGLDCIYMRAIPDKNSADVVFKEWTLYSVENPVCTKVLVPDNEFPSFDLQYNPYGIEYESPFEVHIVKQNFEEQFGLGKFPQQRDILFFPMFSERLYEVKSTSPEMNFLSQMSYWKVDLMIYRAKANTYAPESIQNLLDEITMDSVKAFGAEMEKETLKITKPQQYNRNIGTNLIDPIRKYINTNLKIFSVPVQNHGTIISDSHYDLSSIFEPDKSIVGVEYALTSKFTKLDSFAFSCWFKDNKPKFLIHEDPVRIEKISDSVLRLKLQVIRKYQKGQYLQIFRQGKLNFYGKIVDVLSESQFDIEVEKEVLQYLDSINNSWITAPGWIAKRCFEKVFMDSLVEKDKEIKGWKISQFAERFFILNINGKQIFFNTQENTGDKWNGLFLNWSPIFKQLNFSLWKIKDGVQNNTQLEVVFTQTIEDLEFEDFNSEINYFLPASNIALTNLRIFSEIVPFEKQSLILNQNIVQDSHLLILADDSKVKHRLPFVGSTK